MQDAPLGALGSTLPKAFQPKPVAEVKSPLDYFYCGPWKTTLSAGTCRERHRIANTAVTGVSSKKNKDRAAAHSFERCKVCPVGDEILVKIGKKTA